MVGDLASPSADVMVAEMGEHLVGAMVRSMVGNLETIMAEYSADL